MADAEARFVLTADDRTAAAFRSAERNVKLVSNAARSVSNAFRAFGVVLSARMFASWIRGALDAKNMTVEQLKATAATRNAMQQMREASNQLARTVASVLTPAMQGFATVLKMVDDLLLGNISEYDKMLRELTAAMGDRALIESQIARAGLRRDDGAVARFTRQLASLDAEIASIESTLEEIRKKGGISGALAGPDFLRSTPGQFSLGIEKGRTITGGLDYSFGGMMDPPAFQASIDRQREAARKAAEFRIKLVHEVHMEEMEAERKAAAERRTLLEQSIGIGLKNSLVDALAFGEFQFKNWLKRLAAELAVSGLFSMLAGAFGGPATFLGRVFGGARAGGGPVSAGRSYLVGERGPELFTPGQSGMVHPGGINVYQYNTITGVDGVEKLIPVLARNNQALKAEIRDEMRRGRF